MVKVRFPYGGGGNTGDDSIELDLNEDTLSYGDIGGDNLTGDETITVGDSPNTGETSPAGGSGFAGSVSRFLGIPRDKVKTAIEERGQKPVGEVVERVANKRIEELSKMPDTTPNVIPWDEYRQTLDRNQGGMLGKILIGFVALIVGVSLFGGEF